MHFPLNETPYICSYKFVTYWYTCIHLLSGHALDILARVPLWKDGLDYRHGTGHGIGSYLNVHEGKCVNDLLPLNLTYFHVIICRFSFFLFLIPFALQTGPHLISFRPHARNVPLQATMTVTDG